MTKSTNTDNYLTTRHDKQEKMWNEQDREIPLSGSFAATVLVRRVSYYLQTDAALIMSWIFSTRMSSLQPFVQTYVTHITVEGAVFEDTETKTGTSLRS